MEIISIKLAHLLTGFYFAFYGLWNLYHWIPILARMAKERIPHPYFLLPIGIVIQIAAGVMIILGIYVQLAALILIPFTIIAVFIFHPFWKFHGELRSLNFSIFLANMTVTIAVLLLLTIPLMPLATYP